MEKLNQKPTNAPRFSLKPSHYLMCIVLKTTIEKNKDKGKKKRNWCMWWCEWEYPIRGPPSLYRDALGILYNETPNSLRICSQAHVYGKPTFFLFPLYFPFLFSFSPTTNLPFLLCIFSFLCFLSPGLPRFHLRFPLLFFINLLHCSLNFALYILVNNLTTLFSNSHNIK